MNLKSTFHLNKSKRYQKNHKRKTDCEESIKLCVDIRKKGRKGKKERKRKIKLMTFS